MTRPDVAASDQLDGTIRTLVELAGMVLFRLGVKRSRVQSGQPDSETPSSEGIFQMKNNSLYLGHHGS